MTSQEKEDLKRFLEAKREALLAQLPSLKESARPVAPDNALGRLTRLDAIQSKEINGNALRQVEAQIREMERMLTRMDDPGFGLCRECEHPIPMARLKAMPGSPLCVNCA